MARKKSTNPNTNMVKFVTWNELVDAVADDGFNMTIFQVCQMLKISRSWYTMYIAPHIRYTYIGNGQRGDDDPTANYVSALRNALARHNPPIDIFDDEIEEETAPSILIDRKSLYALLKKANFKATRRTFAVDIDDCMTYAEHKAMSYWWKGEAKHYEMWGTFETPHPPYELEEMVKKRAYVNARTKCKPIDVDVPAFDENTFYKVIKKWQAERDFMRYGDTDERVYRFLFASAAIRIEGTFEDAKGKQVKKVLYYIPNDSCEEYQDERYRWPRGGHRLLLPYDTYLQHKEIIDRNHEELHSGKYTDWETVYEYPLPEARPDQKQRKKKKTK